MGKIITKSAIFGGCFNVHGVENHPGRLNSG